MKCQYFGGCNNEATLGYTHKRINFDALCAECDEDNEALEIDYDKILHTVHSYYCARHYRFIEKILGKDEHNTI